MYVRYIPPVNITEIFSFQYRKGDTHAQIMYETLEAAQAAVQQMRGFPLGGRDKRIRIDYSDLDDESGEGGGGNSGGGSATGSGSYNRGGRGSFGREGDWNRGGGNGGGGRDRPSRDSDRGDRSPPPSSSSTQPLLSDAKNIADVCRTAPKLWEGALIMKSSFFQCKFHGVEGNGSTVAETLRNAETGQRHLKITQRLRLDQSKLDEVQERMSDSSSHAIYLCVTSSAPATTEGTPGAQQRPLRNLVSYLKQKEAAGVISMETSSTSLVLCFPPCAFSYSLLRREAPGLEGHEDSRDDHLVVLVVCGETPNSGSSV